MAQTNARPTGRKAVASAFFSRHGMSITRPIHVLLTKFLNQVMMRSTLFANGLPGKWQSSACRIHTSRSPGNGSAGLTVHRTHAADQHGKAGFHSRQN